MSWRVYIMESIKDQKPVNKRSKPIVLSLLAIAGITLAVLLGLMGRNLFAPKAAHAASSQAPQREVALNGYTEPNFQAKFNQLKQQGWELVWVNAFSVKGQTYYNGIFHPADGAPWMSVGDLTQSQYEADFNQLVNKQGYRLEEVDIYQSQAHPGQPSYAAIFRKVAGPAFQASDGLTKSQLVQQFNTLTKQGYIPVNVSGVAINGVHTYATLYEKINDGGAFESFTDMNASTLQSRYNTFAKQGFHLAYLHAFTDGNIPYYAAIWYKSAPVDTSRANLTAQQYQADYNAATRAGLHTQAVAGYVINGQAAYAAFWH